MSNNSQMPRFISLRSMYHLRPDLIKREKKKGWAGERVQGILTAQA